MSFLILILYFGSGVSTHASQPWCEVLLSPEKGARDDTKGFITYLDMLLEARLIEDSEFRKFAIDLENGLLSNPISNEAAGTSARLAVHHSGLQEYLQRGQMDHHRVARWATLKVGERSQVHLRREVIKVETQQPWRRMEFHHIAPGTLDETVLAEPFEMASTPVTQWQWSMIAGENPSHFQTGPESISVSIRGQMIPMQPDHPVENMLWYDLESWIEKLNALSLADDPLIYNVILDHHKGAQYRLPTVKEWKFVARNRGRSAEAYDRSELDKYAWHDGNSGGVTHPVGELAPLIVDGQAFYDLYGNVFEWTQDLAEIFHRVVCGGSWNFGPQACSCAPMAHRSASLGYARRDVGVRLVRVAE